MSVRRILGAVVALACAVLLSSCSLLPDIPTPGHDDSVEKANVQMQHIASAVKHHDAAALERLFSPAARAKASDLDGGAQYFLSFFRSGRMTWAVENGGPDGTSDNEPYLQNEIFARYKVVADGKKYTLYFADFTINQLDYPKNVGLYALGVTPYTASPYTSSGAPRPFFVWAGQFDIEKHAAVGDPGIYVPHK